MLYLYSGNAVLLQHFRRYLYGRYLLCRIKRGYRECEKEEDQPAHVYSGSAVHPEVYIPVKNHSVFQVERT